MDLFSASKYPTSNLKADVARRLRLARVELFGEAGVEDLAGRLGLPPATWSNYERGVTIPGEILIALLVMTGIEPRWLLRGDGPMLRQTP